jgi:hypothetical protein
MSDKLRAEGKRLADFIASASEELKEEVYRRQREEADAEHAEFKAAFDLGNCYLCGDPLTTFDELKPCAHWLLNPVGFRKKKHFLKVTEKFGFHQLQGYLRWVAHEDHHIRKINDLPDEGTGKLREVTIRYKDFVWSFSCTQNDFHGHGSGSHQTPHYHFQMRQGVRSLINYNDFHVPFSDSDIREISAEIANPQLVRGWSHGEGMEAIMRPEIVAELLDQGGLKTASEGEGDIEFDHLLIADEGTTMKGEDIYNLIQEAKATGQSLGSLLRKGRIPNAKVRTIFSPGPDAIEQRSRSGRGGKPSK